MRTLLAVTLLSVVALSVAQCPQNSTVFKLSLGEGSAWNHYWEESVGSGHALLALREDYRKQLKFAHERAGFKRVRFHGIFDDDLSVYMNPDGKNPTYSFFNVDSIYDYLLSIGMQPIVELSFMPADMANGTDTVFHYKGGITPPKHYSLWTDLLVQFATHLIERYGIDEVSTWYFETWNEPNCGFWTGNQTQYFQLLYTTWNALKSVSPRLQVGGPATCQSQWLPETIAWANAHNIPLDFISTHEYPTDVGNNITRRTMRTVATKARAQVGPTTPLLYTETNDGLYWQPAYHDVPFAAAYAIFTYADTYGLVDLLSWWAFTDIFEEGGFNSHPFQDNYGLITIHGIPKPAFRAFELLHETGNFRVNVEPALGESGNTLDLVATQHGGLNGNTVSLLLTNWDIPSNTVVEETACVIVSNIPQASNLQASLRRIDKFHSNPKFVWENMGSPEYPTKEQLNELFLASEMTPRHIAHQTLDSEVVAFVVNVPPQAVAAITFEL